MFDLLVLRDTVDKRVNGQFTSRPAPHREVRKTESEPRPAARVALRLRAVLLRA
jgi:hypothetical protein